MTPPTWEAKTARERDSPATRFVGPLAKVASEPQISETHLSLWPALVDASLIGPLQMDSNEQRRR